MHHTYNFTIFACCLLFSMCLYCSTHTFLVKVDSFLENMLPDCDGTCHVESCISCTLQSPASVGRIILKVASPVTLQLCAETKIEGRRCCPPQRAFNTASPLSGLSRVGSSRRKLQKPKSVSASAKRSMRPPRIPPGLPFPDPVRPYFY